MLSSKGLLIQRLPVAEVDGFGTFEGVSVDHVADLTGEREKGRRRTRRLDGMSLDRQWERWDTHGDQLQAGFLRRSADVAALRRGLHDAHIFEKRYIRSERGDVTTRDSTTRDSAMWRRRVDSKEVGSKKADRRLLTH